MFKTFILGSSLCLLLSTMSFSAFGQQGETAETQSQEISDVEGIPVLIKHLPDWENKQKEAVFITDIDSLRTALGDRPIFAAVDFFAGTEAVIATYDQGKLLIVEYGTPQASADTDKNVKQTLSEMNSGAPIFYRRIGNYNVFLFDGTDEVAANGLFDRIKYEKVVSWLGTNPFIQKLAEQRFIKQTSILFIATVKVILYGLGFSIITGFFSGIIFYNFRRQKRASMIAFSDGGGLTRLNLDQLTSDLSAGKLLKD